MEDYIKTIYYCMLDTKLVASYYWCHEEEIIQHARAVASYQTGLANPKPKYNLWQRVRMKWLEWITTRTIPPSV